MEIQKAWLIREWSAEIIEGEAFCITYEYYGQNPKAFFRKNENSTWEMFKNNEVVFTKAHADSALERDKESKRDYYKRQIKENTEKLNQLN
jgi:hypothetical protein